MNPSPGPAPKPYPWQTLFPRTGESREAFVIRKRGEPLLLLPADRALAVRALTLYPAQSAAARLAKAALKAALFSRLPLPLERTGLPAASQTAFARFAAAMAGGERFPRMAILAGNPEAAGRRLVLLLFGETGRPAAVVKAGTGEAAARLIEQERAFLEAAGGEKRWRIASLRGSHRDDHCSAIALPFIDGTSPDPGDWSGAGRVLSAWLHEEAVPLCGIPGWQRLLSVLKGEAEAGRGPLEEIGGHCVRPALFHGDFAPWNIRQTGLKEWNVLDWERGEMRGVPGWDWFHYLVQPAMLVEKKSPAQIAGLLETLLASPEFRQYAAEAGIGGIERLLVLSYLEYCLCVLLRQEHASPMKALRDVWSSA